MTYKGYASGYADGKKAMEGIELYSEDGGKLISLDYKVRRVFVPTKYKEGEYKICLMSQLHEKDKTSTDKGGE